MSNSHRRTVGTLAVVLAAALLPATAAATPEGSLTGVRLKGEETCGFKTVYTLIQTPYLKGPVQLYDEGFTPTGQRLVPYEVTILSGEGLKARHLVPGETYGRPGLEPANLTTCLLAGELNGEPLEVEVTGVIRGQPSS